MARAVALVATDIEPAPQMELNSRGWLDETDTAIYPDCGAVTFDAGTVYPIWDATAVAAPWATLKLEPL